MNTVKKPWLKFYGNIPESLDYPKKSLYQVVKENAKKHGNSIAYKFLGASYTYNQLIENIEKFASGLKSLGFKKGDTMSIIMPTCPEGIVAFYAVNKLGGIASMVHPLSTEKEIEYYFNLSDSKYVLTLDMFYEKVENASKNSKVEKIIVSKISNSMPFLKKSIYNLFMSKKVKLGEKAVKYNDLINIKDYVEDAEVNTNELAAILYSGGTTGFPKGVMLSNYNLIAEGMQVSVWGGLNEEDTILAILPIFHGFGLSVCINAVFMGGARSILIPKFELNDLIKTIKKEKPTFLIGVPTLYKAFVDSEDFRKIKLDFLKAAFCGADTLPEKLKRDFDLLVEKSGGKAKLLEGYGLTEAVTAVMAMPLNHYKPGSMGVPFPDMLAKIVEPGTDKEKETGEIGEIVLSGPDVMLGYIKNKEETERVLKRHSDGLTWLHTGDLGYMDEDGFFYFKQRLKRMIKVSGYNVFPAEVENVLINHPLVKNACVIGVEDDYQMTRVKAFVELEDFSKASDELKKELIEYAKKHLIKWSCPKEIEFRKELPLTKIGKVDFKVLEQEEKEKRLKEKKEK
ncbi:long-chain acyl-CoA synthetase [Thermotomaculum hydrothermale]|uniref:Long-chain acyl-CoA synthetase n=1 Tax=Thermotomaculum hydrothermale TaxID=981385 RepID=A0A7R6SYJ6_9BACT|nr:AMP-binding protein [Thermotomaculum hydrothermale]BBB31802.1 long-chain acyl-CoA synthetase [Thermotomaculum hydrothermale]